MDHQLQQLLDFRLEAQGFTTGGGRFRHRRNSSKKHEVLRQMGTAQRISRQKVGRPQNQSLGRS
jgi:hypothetical protein